MVRTVKSWVRHALPALVMAATGCGAPASEAPDEPEGGEVISAEEDAIVGDQCPAPTGVEANGQSRFMYGVNYAWNNFASDFGGIARWNLKGISAAPAVHETKLKDMRAHGANVVRWWVLPEFRGDGVKFDGSESPTGVGGTLIADLNKALELADKADVNIMLCLFSFDGFRPSRDVSGIWVPGLTPMVQDTNKRSKLMENVVRPLARAAEQSPYRQRLIAWDVINEPEWAISGSDPYGDPSFDPSPDLRPVSHAQMESFIAATLNVLHQESSALTTVGSAAIKWGQAWAHVDIDFYQFHIYDWVNQYYPYDLSPSDFGIHGKPVVMGEFPINGLSGVPFGAMVEDWYQNGYAGALGWAYDGASATDLNQTKAFADKHPCETKYTKQSGGGTCVDVAPPGSSYTCAQQAGWGKCNEPWMQGFCDKSCNRCPSTCTNVVPPGSSYTCDQQAGWGKCNEPWMQGFCDKSCGRC